MRAVELGSWPLTLARRGGIGETRTASQPLMTELALKLSYIIVLFQLACAPADVWACRPGVSGRGIGMDTGNWLVRRDFTKLGKE